MLSPIPLPVRALALFGLLLLSRAALAAPAGPLVLVLGDSISAAYGMSLEQGWVALLEERLRETHPDVSVLNASISGDTSGGGRRRLPRLLSLHEPDLVLIELGGNDGLRGYPTTQLRDNLEQMIVDSRAVGARVLLLPMEIPPNYGPRYTRAFRNAFSAAADTAGAALGPFLLDGVATRTELMQDDGIHPTSEAQPRIVETLLPAIQAQLQQMSKNP